jgi:uncharacterized protein
MHPALNFFSPSLPAGYLALFILGALIIGMAKAGMNGFGLAAVQIMALIFGAKESTGVILPMLIAADIMAVIYYRKNAEWKYILLLLPSVVAGILVALVLGKNINNSQFRILLVSIVWLMLILMLVNDLRQKKSIEMKENKVFAIIMGFAGGFSTMIGNAAGPVFTLYFLAMKLPKKEFIGTSAWLYLIMNTGKLPLQALVWKNITPDHLRLGLLSFPVIALGIFAGIQIIKLLPENVFRIFVIVTTLLTSVLLFV